MRYRCFALFSGLAIVVAAVALASLAGQAPGVAAQSGAKQFVESNPVLNQPYSAAVKAGFIYVAGTTARNAKGQIVGTDMTTQARQVFDNLAATLKQTGTSLQNVASTTVYLRNAADFAAMDEVFGAYFPKDPPARTTVMTNLVSPDALIEISMVAIAAGGPRQVILPEGWMRPPGPYSYGIKSGDTLFLAGLVSRNGQDNSVVSGDLGTQVKTAMDNAGAILKAAGMDYADLVSSQVYLTPSATAYQDMNKVYRPYVPTDSPARAVVRTGLLPGFNVEITLTAVKGPPREAITDPGPSQSCTSNPNLSCAIRVGNRLYTSGTALFGNNPNKGDLKAQTAVTLLRINHMLRAAGFEWKHVVDGVVYLPDPDMTKLEDMNAVYREVFAKDFPARATVGTGPLGGDTAVEMMFVAVK